MRRLPRDRVVGDGPTEGFEETKRCIVEVMEAEGMAPDPDDLIVTTGGQQAIDLVTKTLVNPGDPVICEAPTYPGAVPAFCSYEADVHQVSTDDHGMRVDELEELLEALATAGRRPKFIYSVPSFQNPAGVTLSAERRRRLHEQALSYLERRGGPRRHETWSRLARHAEGAARLGRAIDCWGRAGDLAREIHASRDAIACWSRAIDLAHRQADAPASLLCSLYERRSAQLALTGDATRAEEDARWMLARAEKGEQDALRARAHVRLGEALGARERTDEAIESLEVAAAIADRLRDPEIACAAHAGIGRAQAVAGRGEEALRSFERAQALAREAGLVALEVTHHERVDDRHLAGEHLAGAAVDGDDVALADDRTVGGPHPLRLDVDVERVGAAHAGAAHATGDDRGVRRLAAPAGEDAAGGDHAAQVVGVGLATDQDDALAPLGPFLLWVDVYLTDVNGPRGGPDKRCRVVAHLRTGPVVVSRTARDPVAAATEATLRCRRLVRSRLARRRHRRRRVAA